MSVGCRLTVELSGARRRMGLAPYPSRVRSSDLLGGTGATPQRYSFKTGTAGRAQFDFRHPNRILAVTANPLGLLS
jgi:hypothetical protein